MSKSLEELLTAQTEPDPLALRREFPDMIRQLVETGATSVRFEMDARSALNLANDVEFAVKYRGLRNDSEE